MEQNTQEQTAETREVIENGATVLSLSEEEIAVANKLADETDVRQALNAVRQMRTNKAAEDHFRTTYAETKTLEKILSEIKDYRTQKNAVSEKCDMIRSNGQWSDAYKNQLVNEQNTALKDRTDASREATLKLLDDMTADRMAYDKAFFTDPERLASANRIIDILRNSGKNMSTTDFYHLCEPLYGDCAQCRYIWAAIKDEDIPLKRVIEKMAIPTETAFDESRKALSAYFRGQFDTDAYTVARTLTNDAERVGISLVLTDFSKPVYSEERNIALDVDFSEDEAIEFVRQHMKH